MEHIYHVVVPLVSAPALIDRAFADVYYFGIGDFFAQGIHALCRGAAGFKPDALKQRELVERGEVPYIVVVAEVEIDQLAALGERRKV